MAHVVLLILFYSTFNPEQVSWSTELTVNKINTMLTLAGYQSAMLML
jgi:hypothetical protein